MRYLRRLTRHVVPRFSMPSLSRLLLLAISLLAVVAVAAVPALAGRTGARRHSHGSSTASPSAGGRMSTYDRLVRLRRLRHVPPPGTHARTAALPGHEVARLRTARSRTFARGDGTYVTRTYPLSVNFRDSRGRFQPIDNRLVPVGAVSRRQGFAFENTANSYRSFLPRNLSAPVLLAARGSWLSFRMVGAHARASASGDTGRYVGAQPGVDAAYRATNDSLKETLTISDANARSSFDYLLHASRDLKAVPQRDGGIAFLNRRGKVMFTIAAPFVYDRAQKPDGASYSAVAQRLTRIKGGYRLRLRVKPSYLHAKDRSFPVTVDPTVSHIENTGDTRLHQNQADLDCYVHDGSSANTSQCGGQQLLVGWDGSTQRRAMLRFDIQNSLPKGIKVLDAELGLYMLDNDFDNTPATVNIHRITRSWTGAATWNKYDGTNNWTTAGGDYDSTVAASNTVNAWGQWYKWFPRQLVQGWIDGSITNNGVIVKEATERSINNRFYFWSSSAPFSQLPYLDVVYEPQTGQRPYYKFDGRKLSDRMDLNVNVASGNLLLHANDVRIKGTGLDLGIDRYYNDQLERVTDLSEGWTMGSGADVRLRTTSDSAIFYAPSGYVVDFQKNADGSYSAPKGIDATLCTVNGTTCKGTSTYALTFNHAQIRNNFDSSGKLVSQRDKNDNKLQYAYDASGHLTTITDTQNRVVTVTTNTSGLITQLTDSTGRTWQYGYDANNELTTYTDPEGKITHYLYDSGGELHEIDNPRGGVIWIWYDSSANDRVTRVQRVNDNAPDEITDFAYSSGSSPCQSSDFGKTVETDGNGHTTTYCYDKDGKVNAVFDAKGKKQKISYDSNSFVNSYTSANNSTSGFNTMVDRNSTTNSVNSVSQATGSGAVDPNLKTSFGYDTAGTNSYSPFFPQSSKSPQGHGTGYTYDTQGNIKSTTDTDSGNHVDVDYETAHPGRLAKVTDANGNATNFTNDSQGNPITIAPPTLDPGTGTQIGTTQITYDGLSRPCVVKDGKNQRTAYVYDKLDRVKSITKYNAGATNSGCTVTGTIGKTVTLTYDNNGNLTQRVDPVGTSTYAYNELNRLNSQSFPTGRSNSYTYDNVGNLKTLTDAGGTVTYAYDSDNLLASVADPGGSCTTTPTTSCTTFNVDDDGDRTKTTYPNGVVITNDYDAAHRLTCTMATNGAPSANCQNQTSPMRRFVYNYLDSSSESPTETTLRQSVRDEAGNVTSYTYDSLDRLKTATTRNSGGTITDDYTYTYDGAGNMVKRDAKSNGGSTTTTTYKYNKDNELCWSASGTPANACGSAPAGATTYTYDANGNQTAASNGRAYVYNVLDQATSLTAPGGTANAATYLGPNQAELTQRGSDGYGNNVLGIGLKVHSDATVSYFTRDENGAVLEERSPAGKYYYVPDGLGSTIVMTSSTGAVANSYKYDPYGNIVSQSETTAHPNPFRFVGGLYSSSIALHKFGQRWYDQSIARWSQQDPIDQTGDLREGNRYLYVGDDPINKTDPNGTDVFDDIGDGLSDAADVGVAAVKGAAIGGASSFLASGGNFAEAAVGAGIGAGAEAGATIAEKTGHESVATGFRVVGYAATGRDLIGGIGEQTGLSEGASLYK